jgi:hypothetical protein
MKLKENSSSGSHTDACRQTDGQALFAIYVDTPKKGSSMLTHALESENARV